MKTNSVIIVVCIAMALAPLCGNSQQFTNIADSQGLYHTLTSTDKWGSGVSFFDFNRDGWDDIVLTQEFDSVTVYLNNHGVFQQISLPVYVNGRNKQFLWVDYDNDGDYDILLSTRFDTFRLFRNLGDTLFEDVTVDAGLSNTPASNYGVSFGDYNRDGWLDLYVCRYNGSGDPLNPAHVNALYRNNGDGTFTDVTFQAGVSDGTQPSFQAAWIDFDKDGWQDIYVINDRGSWDNSLYRNNGDGTFTNVAEAAGALFAGNDPMTISVADFNHTGWLDIFMTNTGTGSPGNQKLAMLLENNGDGTFTEAAENYGVDFDELSWGATWLDYDNDSYQDLYVCTGRSSNFFPILSNHFYNNEAAEYFSDSTGVFIGDHVYSSFAVAKGDIDNNGFADLVVQNIEDANFLLWQNSGNENNYIKVTLEGQVSNKMAIGSWIYLYVGENTYTHYTLCGENYLSQNSQHHIFGLDSVTQVDSIAVKYLSGHQDVYHSLDANTHYYFKEGESYQIEIDTIGSTQLCENDTTILSAGNHAGYLWNTGDSTSVLAVYEPGTYYVQVWNEFGVTTTSQEVIVSLVESTNLNIEVTDVSCAEMMNGSISVSAATGSIAQILWNTNAEDTILLNVPSGIYNFTVQDSNGCHVYGEVYVDEPPPLIGQIFATDVLCFGDSTGMANLQVAGGTPPYSYHWNYMNPANLPSGDFEVTVTDSNDCEIVFDFTILQPDPIQIEVTPIHATSAESTGSALLEITGGNEPYAVIWSTGLSNGYFLDDLTPGMYYVVVEDFNQCIDTVFFEIDIQSGYSRVSESTYSVHPNPSNGIFYVSHHSNKAVHLILYNQLGQKVYENSQYVINDRIDAGQLGIAVYIMQINDGTKTFIEKVLINH